MSKKLFVALTLCILASAATFVRAQDAAKPSPLAEPGHAYRLDFTLNELEDGKKINSRQYAMNVNAGDQGELKIGTRVPVEVKQSEIQYLDVGTSIWCRLRDHRDVSWLGGDLLLNVRSEMSNFALPDPQSQGMRPVVRQMKIDANTILVDGKMIVVGVVDDPNSKRQFQLDVTATKLR
jgi:hypothetical protein